MSADNYFVVRKHPKGGYTYVTGFESDKENWDSHLHVNIPVTDNHFNYPTYKEALAAALEDYSEYGVTTHPECEEQELVFRAEITE